MCTCGMHLAHVSICSMHAHTASTLHTPPPPSSIKYSSLPSPLSPITGCETEHRSLQLYQRELEHLGSDCECTNTYMDGPTRRMHLHDPHDPGRHGRSGGEIGTRMLWGLTWWEKEIRGLAHRHTGDVVSLPVWTWRCRCWHLQTGGRYWPSGAGCCRRRPRAPSESGSNTNTHGHGTRWSGAVMSNGHFTGRRPKACLTQSRRLRPLGNPHWPSGRRVPGRTRACRTRRPRDDWRR